jgi:uncharacterized protein YggU (UPF0235/DUF167 family)
MEVKIKVTAGSAKAKIISEKNRLLVYVKAEKSHNMANKEVVALISKHFGANIENVSIKRGLRSENKIIEVG